ncbi:MAG: hypothetical protein KIT32_12350 [Rhodocyclaceae bacterium]|nr:hypothetical protein [Rhodocyclaceae bacterium]
MNTDPATNPVAEQPTVPQEVAPAPELEAPVTDEQPEGQALDDSEEVEYEGNKYKVPKAIAPALLRQADYTKKTQEVAETRRTLEADKRTLEGEKRQLQEHARAVTEDLEDHAQLYASRKQLEQFQNVNWDQLDSEDPIRSQALWRQFQMLQNNHNAIASRLQAKMYERNSRSTAEAARMREQTRSALAKEIPNWSDKTEHDLTDYAVKHGYKPEEVKLALDTDSRPFRFLHKAFLYDQLIEKQRQAAKAQAPAEPVKPVGTGRVPVQGLHDNLSTEEWIKRRNAQLQRRA